MGGPFSPHGHGASHHSHDDDDSLIMKNIIIAIVIIYYLNNNIKVYSVIATNSTPKLLPFNTRDRAPQIV